MNTLGKILRCGLERNGVGPDSQHVLYVLGFALLLAVSASNGILYAQAAKVSANSHQSSFGFSNESSPQSKVVLELSQLEQLETADRFVQRRLRSSSEDFRSKLSLATTFQSYRLTNSIKALDVTRREYDDTRREIEEKLKDNAASLQTELFNSNSQSPYVEEATLFFEFAAQKCLLDLARQYVATSLVSTRDEELRSSAQRSIFDSMDALNKLHKNVENRVAEIAILPNDISRQAWMNELYRLINEVHLLKVDLLAMQLEFVKISSEGEKVAAANNLLREIDMIASKLSADSAYSPRLNLLRAKSMAAVGDHEKAILMLDEDLLRIANEQMFLDNRQTAAEILLQTKSPANKDRARAILMKVLVNAEAIPASMVLTAFEYNAMRAMKDSKRLRTDLELTVTSGEQVARAMTQDLSFADVLEQKEAIGREFGAYWRLRAEAILLDASNSIKSSNNGAASLPVDLMLAEVKQDLLANRFREAIEKLNNIEEQYVQQGNLSAAFATNQRRNALFYQLLRKEEERAVTDNTRRARLEIARRFSESALKYATLQNVESDFLRSIQIAQAALSSNAQINKSALGLIEDIAVQHATHFPNSKSVSQSFDIVESLLAPLENYERISDLYRSWQSIAISKQADQEQIDYASNRQSSYLAFHYLTSELPLAVEKASTDNEVSKRDDLALQKIISSIYWADKIALDATNEQNAKDSIPVPWLAQLHSDRQQLLESVSAAHESDVIRTQSIDSPELIVAELIKFNFCCELLLNQRKPTTTKLVELAENQLGKFDALRDQVGVLSSMHKSAAFHLLRNRSIVSVIQSGSAAELTEFKSFVAERQTFENMLWYARLLAAQGSDGQKSAINLLTRLAGKEPIGSMNWYRAKADLLYAKSLTTSKQDALRDLDYLMTIAPKTPESWKREIVLKLSP